MAISIPTISLRYFPYSVINLIATTTGILLHQKYVILYAQPGSPTQVNTSEDSLLAYLMGAGSQHNRPIDATNLWDFDSSLNYAWRKIFGDSSSGLNNLQEALSTCSIIDCQVDDRSVLMEHPIESGAKIVDHKVFMPRKFKIRIALPRDNYQSAYQQLYNLFHNNTYITLQTKAQIYENLQITEIPHIEADNTVDRMIFTITLTEVKIVEAYYIKPEPKAKPVSTPTKKKGNQKVVQQPAEVKVEETPVEEPEAPNRYRFTRGLNISFDNGSQSLSNMHIPVSNQQLLGNNITYDQYQEDAFETLPGGVRLDSRKASGIATKLVGNEIMAKTQFIYSGSSDTQITDDDIKKVQQAAQIAGFSIY